MQIALKVFMFLYCMQTKQSITKAYITYNVPLLAPLTRLLEIMDIASACNGLLGLLASSQTQDT